MKEEQRETYAKLALSVSPLISVSDFEDVSDRTLTLGHSYGEYDGSKIIAHVYLKDKELFMCIIT